MAGIPIEHVDVVIIGAGMSGIAAAHHLREQCPEKRFVILETQDDFGGTWRTHRYPGVRSDSDLHTFGYRFKPWTGAPIATAEEILSYVGSVIHDDGLENDIRYRHRVEAASWSGHDNQWTITACKLDTDEPVRFTANFLWMCQGYYRHAQGYTPEWEGMESFKGRIVHPQTWPADLDYEGKTIVVIGSGATAATLLPAMAQKCGHAVMLQRSPTYFITGRNANALAEELRQLQTDERWIHEIVRRKILHDHTVFARRAREEPDTVKEELLAAVRSQLGDDYDIDTHFTPRYRPWQQRVAFIPDGDFFKAIREEKASVVTDDIERFDEHGIILKSGRHLQADIVVTATGFNLNVLGDIAFTIDGEPLKFCNAITYRGMMFTGVPNMAWVFGYFRASWTLRADLVGDFVCRLLQHMDEKGVRRVVPRLRPENEGMKLGPWVDPDNFNPGYLSRGMHLLPRQGDISEWRHTQDYWDDKDAFPGIDLDDAVFDYTDAPPVDETGTFGRKIVDPVSGEPIPMGGARLLETNQSTSP